MQVPRQATGIRVAGTDVARVEGRTMHRRTVRQDKIDRIDMIAHDAVAQRTGAAGVVGRHSAQRRPAGGRDVDRKPKAYRLQAAVELVEDKTRTHDGGRASTSTDSTCREMLREIDDKGVGDGLAALRRAPRRATGWACLPRALSRATVMRSASSRGTTTPMGMI